MKRLLPYLILLLITGGLVAFIYKDRIFPPDPSASEAPQGMLGGPGAGPTATARAVDKRLLWLLKKREPIMFPFT